MAHKKITEELVKKEDNIPYDLLLKSNELEEPIAIKSSDYGRLMTRMYITYVCIYISHWLGFKAILSDFLIIILLM